ncbi:cytochrome P450 [Lentinula edodes]|uniref:cytochrome P450 n=1 Tax=Lentinula edodes TaxID=5353 RepID=UPI001E8D753D|nr:cytochrome P450 [Lentinula edodes]KAH7877875.1 cytochrome P450 [Lentinula edodes]KAJ3908674.1 cytochrome P450 [Lentinula edodes]
MQNITASQFDPVVDSVQRLFSNRTYLDLFVVGFTIAITALIRYASASNGLKLPPGPAPSFIVGNMNDIPVYEEWHTLNQWAKRFGEIVYLRVFGTKMLVIGSYRVANELLDKRGAIYSDRPITPPMMEMAGFANSLTVMGNNADYRLRRRLFEQHFRYSVIDRHQPTQIRETHKLLRKYIEAPENWLLDTKYTIGAIILDIVYGYRVTSDRDEWVEIGERAGTNFQRSVKPGAWAVDVLPFLRYVPTWFPFTGWKTFALDSTERRKIQVDGAFELVKKAMKEGTAHPSMVSRYLEENENGGDIPEVAIMDMASDAYGGGVETTLSSIYGFLLQMTKHRSIQQKAQAELDRVCPDRLPTFDDRKNLPYIEAIAIEVGRWHPGVPQGIAHRLEKDDEFEGQFLPKGSLVIPNIWGMCHDEGTYKSADVFDPDRFMNAAGDAINTSIHDPRQMVFGFGRRQCPGRAFAESQLFFTMALILKVFNVLPPLDAEGKEIMQPDAYRSGIVSVPKPFSCRIVPRSNAMAELVRQTE